tara:strand:+ start:2817 stop:5198 length:2382 start_codon:yes stop_codon:yes gene_type:complete
MRQSDLDSEMIELGRDRYWSKVNRGQNDQMETYSPVAKRLLGESIIRLQETIEFWCHNARTGPGRKHRCLEYIELLPSDLVAALTARTVLDGISMRRTLTAISIRLGQYLEDEYRFRKIQEEEPELWKSLFNRTKKHGGYVQKRRFIHKSAKAAGVVLPRWTGKVACSVGLVLVELMKEATGLIEIKTINTLFNRSTTMVMATDDLLDWIKKAHGHHEILSPVFLPTVVKPMPWQSIYIGGYHSDEVRRRPLVKSYDKKFLEELNNTDMPAVYECLGHEQDTAWRINEEVLKCVRHAYDHNHQVGGLPTNQDHDLPDRPDDWEDPVQQKLWRRHAAEIHRLNNGDRSKRLQLGKILYLAEKFKGRPIWFPKQCDFRGRTYDIPSPLNCQGCSVAKALLEFSEGDPIENQNDANWLAVQAANTWGHDKKTFDYRVKWVWENEDLFRRIAKDPLGYTQWKDADEPWEFLAVAMDIGRFLEQGYGYVSRTAVAQDASNQGLQIYALLLRDEEAARNTNVLPSNTPQDLYAMVAQRVIDLLKNTSNDYNDGWLSFGITRATTKRQTMVLPYGSTKQSCKEYTIEWFQEMLTRRGVVNPFDEVFKPCIYLSDLIWDSIGDVVSSARVGMDWLRNVARICMENKVNPMWTSPSGFLVKQLYEKQASYEVKTSIGEKIRRHRLQYGRGEAAPRRNINGISPNYVHSLDAALKTLTINLSASAGVSQFAAVHDSLSTTAKHSGTLATAVRQSTVDMFTPNLLEVFRNQIECQLPVGVELPDVPAMGKLNITKVMESDYYFA